MNYTSEQIDRMIANRCPCFARELKDCPCFAREQEDCFSQPVEPADQKDKKPGFTTESTQEEVQNNG